jgi:hypothetical protein
MSVLISLVIMGIPNLSHARLNLESWYVDKYCPGEIEHVFSDSTRADCIAYGYAAEFDFADKWAESIGQALHYANMANLWPAVVIIIESQADCKYLARIEGIAERFVPELAIVTVGPEAALCGYMELPPVN